jgi:purine-binding chemotaxis protein CheW
MPVNEHGLRPHASSELSVQMLIARCGQVLCAVPVSAIAEVMRPMEMRSLAGAPSFIAGVSVIRGQAVPVLIVAHLLGASTGSPASRFITLRVGDRLVALGVDAVIGFRWLDQDDVTQVPPLLSQAHPELIEQLGRLDDELVVVLRSAGLIADGQWSLLAQDAPL